MDAYALSLLCKEMGRPFPKDVILKDRYWYVARGARLGWEAVASKYGKVPVDEKYRRKKWFEWWEREGRRSFYFHPLYTVKAIRKPRYSTDLAELVGILLGDGGISPYQVTVTLHLEDDRAYGKFVARLMKRLFHVPVAMYPDEKDSVMSYVISRVELVRFCTERLGLKVGNKVKQQVSVPQWIQASPNYAVACLRGLIDTDGSVFTHRYRVHGKEYRYKKLDFTSASVPIRNFVFHEMSVLRLHPRLAGTRAVRLDSIEQMQLYFALVGTHNPKHLKRYQN